jgi:hypothetical protein
MTCPAVRETKQGEQLRLGLMAAGRRLLTATDDHSVFHTTHAELTSFCLTKLVPHLERDERWLVEADECAEARLLALAMRAEARTMTAAVYDLVAATTPCEAMASTRVLHALLAAHAHHEDRLVTATGRSGSSQGAPGRVRA